MTDQQYETEMDAYIRDVFDQNYELLRLESTNALAPDVKARALQQVLLFWQMLRDVAENVTDTEVRLSLPRQETPKEREFSIEGVVDIVRDDDQTIMYDIKTHDADYVRANIEVYEQQLNVYAYVWQELRKERLDQTAVIATNYPDTVADALSSGDEARLEYELSKWNPLVEIEFDRASVDSTIGEFGEIVDAIQDGRFAPRSLEDLKKPITGGKTLFATWVCRNCDARFSCVSYRRYAMQGRGRDAARFRQYFSDLGPDGDQEGWRTANLDAAPTTEDLRRDFVE